MRTKDVQVFRPPCDYSSEIVSAKAYLEEDLSYLMPYLNATQEKAQYYPKGPFIKFKWQGRPVTVEPGQVAVGGFQDNESAREGLKKVLYLLSELDSKKQEIEPDHTPYNPPSVMDIFKLLPKRAGCKRCGFDTCMAFAYALSKGEAEIDSCPALCEEEGSQKARQQLYDLFS